MKYGFKRFFAILLALVLVLAFAGCGDESSKRRERRDKADDNPGSTPATTSTLPADPGTSGSNSGSNADNNNNGSGLFANKDDKLTIYKVGNNKLVFAISGPSCEGLAPKDEYTGSDNKFDIRIGDENTTSISLETSYQNASWLNGENWEYASCYDNPQITKTTFWVSFTYDNICNTMNFNDNISLYYYNRNSGYASEDKIVFKGKGSEIVKTVSEEELNSAYIDFMKGAIAVNPAQAAWTGTYLTTGYYDTALCDVEITEGGLVHLHLNYAGKESDYFLEEKDFSSQTYAYGTYESARASMYYDNGNGSIVFEYDNECGEIDLNYYKSNYNRDEYENAYMKPVFGGWHEAPADYQDGDKYGLYTTDSGDATYFAPTTDDYIIIVYGNDSYYIGSDSSVVAKYSARLYSFDANGIQCSNDATKIVFENSTDASKYCAYISSAGYSSSYYVNIDNVVYCNYDYGPYYCSKMDLTESYDWYVGKSYADYSYRYGDSVQYCYFSKPITSSEYSVGMDDIITWGTLGGNSHYSTEFPNCTAYMAASSGDVAFYVNDNSSNVDKMYYVSYYSYRMNGMNTVICGYDTYEKKIYFQDWVIGSDVAEVTEYMFKVDSFDSVAVNFDNYKTMTADRILTNKFDMTSKVSY